MFYLKPFKKQLKTYQCIIPSDSTSHLHYLPPDLGGNDFLISRVGISLASCMALASLNING